MLIQSCATTRKRSASGRLHSELGWKKRKVSGQLHPTGKPGQERVPENYRDCLVLDFTCKQLRDVCRTHGWKGFGSLCKVELAKMVDEQLIRSQQALFDQDRKLIARPLCAINDTDAITQNNLLRWDPAYLFTVESKDTERKVVRRVHQFEPVELVRMMLTTGETHNPFNRQPFTISDIRRLEARYIMCLRMGSDAPKDKRLLLRLRPDISPATIGLPPTRKQLSMQPEDPVPEPIDGFAPWLTTDTLRQRAKNCRMRVKSELQTEETRNWLIEQLENVSGVVERFLCGEEDNSGVFLRCQEYLELAMRTFVPMLNEATEELSQFDIPSMWEQAERIAERLRNLAEMPQTVVFGTASMCILGMYIDNIVRLMINERLNPTSIVRASQVSVIYPEIQSWSRRYSSSAVIQRSMQNQLYRLMS
jgi:hypothetical protein